MTAADLLLGLALGIAVTAALAAYDWWHSRRP